MSEFYDRAIHVDVTESKVGECVYIDKRERAHEGQCPWPLCFDLG